MSAGRPLLARVQRHRTPAKASSLTVDVEEADGPLTPCTEEQGTVFKQNVAIMRDTLREDVAPPSVDATPRAEPLSAIPRAELPCVEVPFSPFIDQRLT